MNALVTMRQVRGAGGEVRHVPTPFTPPVAKKKARKPHVPDPMKTQDNAGEELRLLIERGERLEEERKGIADDIADFLAEAKSRGYDPKALKKIMSIRKKRREEFQEEEAILETYMQALGML